MNASPGSSFPLEPAQLAVPIALGASLVALASAQADAVTAAETLYLALLATAVLLPLFLVPRRVDWLAEGAALAVGAAVWALPEGGLRAATVGLLVTAALVIEAVAAARRERPVTGRRGPEGAVNRQPAAVGRRQPAAAASRKRQAASRRQPAVSPNRRRQPSAASARNAAAARSTSLLTTLVALALATQMIARGELLLAPTLDLRTLVSLVGLPAVAAVAAWALEPRYGRSIWIALPLVVALGPGFRVAPTLTLAAFATTALAGRRRLAGLLLLAAVLGAAALWRWPFALVLAGACAVALAAEQAGWRLALAAAAGALALVPGIAPVPPTWQPLLWLLLLVPLAPLALRRDGATLLAAVALAALGGRWFAGGEALAPALALLVLHPEAPEEGSASDAAFDLQALWSGALFAGSLMLAGYPWLRAAPLVEVVPLAGVPVSWVGVALVIGFASLLALAPLVLPSLRRAVVPIGIVALFVAASSRLPEPALEPFAGQVFVLDAKTPVRQIELPPRTEVESVTLDSYLSNGNLVAPGAEVARLVFEGDLGESVYSVRAGVDTGEWAARRLPASSTEPAAWLSWVTPDGFFAQRYRGARTFAPPAYPQRLRLELAPGVPPELALTVFGVSVR